MAKTIEELDFKLVVDNKSFDKQIKKAKQQAAEMNISLSKLLELRKESGSLSAKEYQTLKRLDNLESNRRINAEKELAAHARRLAAEESVVSAKKRGNDLQLTHNRLLNEAKNIALSYASIWGAKKLVSSIIETTAEFELQRTTLAAMLQDAEKANQIFEQMKVFSVKSPFSFKELATYAKQLSAYSVPVGELYDTTKMLADVSAGLGVGMDRLVLAYGQIRSAEFLRGQEVRQLTESGIPILEELRKQFVALGEEGITVSDVFDKISQRLVPFEMVQKVFKDMTSEGGKFYKMQEVQSETLRGKISNLKDAYMIMFDEIGSSNNSLLKGGVDVVRKLAENYEKIGRILIELVASYGAYRSAIALTRLFEMAAIQAHLGHTSTIKGLGAAIEILIKKSAAYAAIQKLIAKFNPYAAIAAGVTALAAAFINNQIHASKFRQELEGIANTKFNEAEKSAETFKKLADQLKNSTEGSQAYRDAISELNRQYGDYLPNLLNEKNALTEILRVENEITNAIYARAKAYASEEGEKKIIDEYGEKELKAAESLRYRLMNFRTLDGKQIGEDVANEFIKNFKDVIQNDGRDAFEVFNELAESFFGKTFLITSIGGVVGRYVDVVRDVKKANDDLQRNLDVLYNGSRYSSVVEMSVVEPIEKAYDAALKKLRSEKLPAEEFAEQAKNLQLTKLMQLKDAFVALDEEARKAGKEGSWANKIKEVQEQIDALQPKDLSWLQKYVNPFVTGRGNNDLKVKDDTDYREYIENIRKEYKAVSESYADSDATYKKLMSDKKAGIAIDESIIAKAKEQNDLYIERKAVIESIAKALGISFEENTRKTTGKSEAQIELESRIDLLKKLMSAYEELSEYVDDEKMKSILPGFFSASEIPGKDEIIQRLDFRNQLIELARELEKYDKDAAERLRSSIGYDEALEQAKEYKELLKAENEALKAKKSLEDFLKGWNVGDETEGEGAVYKITKIVSDYKKELEALSDKRGDAIEKLNEWIKAEDKAGRTVDESTKSVKESAIETKYNTASVNLLNKATENVRKAAADYIKEWADVQGIDLTNWSEKSIYELNRIQDALNNFDASNLPEEIKESLESAGIDIEVLKKALQDLINSYGNQAEDRKKEERLKKVVEYANELSDIFGKIREYAESIDNTKLSAFASGLESSFRTMGKIASSVLQKDYIGAAVSFIDSIVSAFAEASAKAAELASNIRKGKIEAASLRASLALNEDTDSIFGEDSFQKIVNAWEFASKKYKEVAEDVARSREMMLSGTDDDTNGWATIGGILSGAATGALAGAAYGSALPVAGTAIGAAVGAVVGLISGLVVDLTRESNNFVTSLEVMAQRLNAPLIDEKTGTYNINTLQLILDTFTELDEKSKETIENMIERGKEFEEAVLQLSDGMRDVFGDVADDLASKFISAFKASGVAALDYRDTLDEVATSLAQMVVKNMLLKTVFDDNTAKELAGLVASGRVPEALETFKKIMNDAADLEPYIQSFLEGIKDYIKPESEGGDTVASGIKSITEDSANLLASYINAIRADVSYSKVQRDQILLEIKGIASYIASPTLMDYLNKIQANTYDTANHTREILSDLRAMMTNDAGETALRVYRL